jgi:hypothetical protein
MLPILPQPATQHLTRLLTTKAERFELPTSSGYFCMPIKPNGISIELKGQTPVFDMVQRRQQAFRARVGGFCKRPSKAPRVSRVVLCRCGYGAFRCVKRVRAAYRCMLLCRRKLRLCRTAMCAATGQIKLCAYCGKCSKSAVQYGVEVLEVFKCATQHRSGPRRWAVETTRMCPHGAGRCAAHAAVGAGFSSSAAA